MPVVGEDWVFTGSVSGENLTPGDATVDNSKVKSGAAISPEKLLNLFRHIENFGLDHTDTPVAANRTVYRAKTAATIRYFAVWLEEAGSATDIDVDLQIDDATALSAVCNILHGTGDRVLVVGTLSTTALAAGEVVNIDVDVSGGTTGAQGLRAHIEIEEAAI